MRRGLVPSRERAQAAIASGRVRVAGAVTEKPSRMVDAAESLDVVGPPPRFVSRGGEKLEAALVQFGIAVAGRRALDAGSSTGGFTDCLLQRGAASVVAVDVGRGQLDAGLRADPRVVVRERTDVRSLPVDEPVEMVVADLSFISLRTVAGHLVAWAAPSADLVVLVKPQYEAGRAEVSKGRGVIRDPATWRAAVEATNAAFEAAGAAMMGLMASPLRGADGNVEFLAHFRTDGTPRRPLDVAAIVSAAAP